MVSGQGVDAVVLHSCLPAPSVLVIVLHENLEPAWCPGKVLTQWSSILSFPAPSVLVIVLHETLEPAWCPGKC